MRTPNLPTSAQTLECFRVCYQLTMMFQPIYLVRIDERTNNIVVIAGEETQIAIDRQGARSVL